MFNVLAAHVEWDGASVLDLYAGSGALGLEAISRGARSATFVEADRKAAATIEANVTALGVHDAEVRCATVDTVLAASASRRFDVVFADPPYEVAVGDVESMLAALAQRHWVVGGAVAVVERATNGPEIAWPAAWSVWQVRRYGDTRLEFGELA